MQLAVTFTDTQGLLTQNSFLGVGLYYSGEVAPIGSGLNGTATSAFSTAQPAAPRIGRVMSPSSAIPA